MTESEIENMKKLRKHKDFRADLAIECLFKPYLCSFTFANQRPFHFFLSGS